ncbi:hypothetical protein D3C73_1432220 [compost metagenome]
MASTPSVSRKAVSSSVSTPSAITFNSSVRATATMARASACDTGFSFTPRTKLASSLMASSGMRASCDNDE